MTVNSIDWSDDDDSSATAFKQFDHYYTSETWTWPRDHWIPIRRGTYSYCDFLNQQTTTNDCDPPDSAYLLPMESCAVNYARIWNDNTSSETFSCVAQTRLFLRTGGKALPGRRNLIVLHADGAVVTDAQWHPPTPLNSGNSLYLGPERMIIRGQSVGTDGYLYLALPDGAELDITPTVADCDIYAFEVNPTKHRLVSQTVCSAPANTPDTRTTIGIGEQVLCSMARRSGRWQLNPLAPGNRHTCPG